MKLRPHQERAIQMARESIKQGYKRPIIAAHTSFGKTVLAGQMLKNCADMGKRGWFFCDRINLVDQTIDKLNKMGVEFGVRQSNHELRNPNALIQIASVQTVAAMVKNHNGRLPEFDFALVDECHTQYEILKQIIAQYNNIPIVGLTATPYSKGLGKLYNNLLVPSTPRESLERGDLCPIRYYGGEHIDLSKIRSNNANEFNPADIERETNRNKELLTGCIIKNWLEWSGREQTIAFSPTQDHSKFLVEKFNSNGISAEHIDCYTPDDDRRAMFEAHNKGEFKILSCSRLLNTGYDAPTLKCIIDCFPVKSVTTYVQRIGRLQRTAQGKEFGVYLGHAGNFERFGYAEDIIPTELHDGESPYREQDLISKKEKKDAKVKDCPQCYQQMQGVRCMSCGYQVPMSEQLQDDGTMLQEIGNKAYRETGQELAQRFYSDLVFHGNRKKMNSPIGWAKHKFKEKFDCWPSFNHYPVDGISKFTKNEFARDAIARKHIEKKGRETIEALQEMFSE